MKKEHGLYALIFSIIVGGSTLWAKFDELLVLLAQDKINNAVLIERDRVESVEAVKRRDVWRRLNECTPYMIACRITPQCAQHFPNGVTQ